MTPEEQLREKDFKVRLAAVDRVLEEMPDRAGEVLGDRLRGELNPQVKAAIAEALGKVGASDRIPALRALLVSSSPEVRKAAVKSLGVLDDPGIKDRITGLISDNDQTVVAEAARVIWGKYPQELLDSISRMLSGESKEARKTAVWALGELQFSISQPMLEEARLDSSITVRFTANDMLAKLEENLKASRMRCGTPDSVPDPACDQPAQKPARNVRGYSVPVPPRRVQRPGLDATMPVKTSDAGSSREKAGDGSGRSETGETTLPDIGEIGTTASIGDDIKAGSLIPGGDHAETGAGGKIAGIAADEDEIMVVETAMKDEDFETEGDDAATAGSDFEESIPLPEEMEEEAAPRAESFTPRIMIDTRIKTGTGSSLPEKPEFHELVSALASDTPEERIAAIMALTAMSENSAVPDLLMCLNGENHPRVVATLVKAVGLLDSDGIVGTLLPYLNHSVPRVVANTLEGLEPHMNGMLEKTVEPFTGALNHRVRAAALLIMHDRGRTGEALAGAAELLGSSEKDHRTTGMRLLADIATPEAAAVLAGVMLRSVGDERVFAEKMITHLLACRAGARRLSAGLLERIRDLEKNQATQQNRRQASGQPESSPANAGGSNPEDAKGSLHSRIFKKLKTDS